MDAYDFLRLLIKLAEIAAWPVVAVLAILAVRPHLSRLLSGAKVKLSIAGQTIETTLPELTQAIEAQAGESLSADHINYLVSLKTGMKDYPGGVKTKEERKFLRPLRNTGLVATVPRNVFLDEATGIELTALGRLFLSGREAKSKSGT